MSQAVQSIEIKATPKACFEIITDYESYPEFLKDLKEVRVDKKSGTTSEVTFTIEILKKISYTLKLTEKSMNNVQWTMLRGDMMKSNDGEWVLEEAGNGLTKATYKIEVSFGLLVPGTISKMLIGSNLPSMLKSFKERIEKKKKK